ncbi:MAG: membrane dipeptidase [Chloroflexota bacterium]|nr:membrane dipeptidase [Chloroflexota bacterium]
MLIDAHLDLAFNAVGLGADLRMPLRELHTTEFGVAAAARGETPTVALPAIRAADIRVVLGTIFVQKPTQAFNLVGPFYSSAEEANAQGWAQLRYYHDLDAQGEITLIGTSAELDAALSRAAALPGLVPLMEGADPIRNVDELATWHQAGLRIVGPAWSGTRYSGGTGAPGPLTAAGRELVAALGEHHLALDTSHMAEASFWEALRLFDGPVIASHANCRKFIPTDRHLSDDMIKALVERDGVVGVVLGNPFLVAGVSTDDGKAAVPLTAVVRHIEHICNLAGDTKHVGLGSDFDGGFGVEGIPDCIESIADLPRIGGALRDAGWSADDIAGVLGGNWARWLRSCLP